ncbi:hypothetical protein PB2503_07444 [Parvularcula bermudensis HTCC2503]|uniref:Sulfotransferase n=1 Tax=Parvularcula bermudensis (strain ATCC BAA-594 / HTCC2503 / KCTC 12087) TaxID=314260 RepID=E0TFE5_PARBH|nr:sulfotransferase [Parvularcula bermudensis]ADM09546.1 hypothetical protein PB2503_07444 [Parvularcula bermudensis HTCC2503]
MAFPPPLFILAPPRSFTSVVNGVIGQHPEIMGMPELNVFQAEMIEEFWTGRRPDGGARSPFWHIMRHDGILRAVAQLYAGEQTIDSIEMAKRWLTVRFDKSAGEVYRELCEKVSPRILLDKSPAYARRRDYLDRIIKAFPDARFIHLIRHPRDQCASILKADGGELIAFFMGAVAKTDGQYFIDPQTQWRDAHRVIIEFLLTLPRKQWMRIKGEDFMNDIEGGAIEICEWLGISTAPEALEAMRHPENSPFASIGPANARLGNDPNYLNSPALRPTKIKTSNYSDPLKWRPDGGGFEEDVKKLASYFGYQ